MFRFFTRLYKRFFFRKTFGLIGVGAIVKRGHFGSPQGIRLGRGVYVGPGAFWDAAGGIEVSDNVIIGPKSTIWSVDHNYQSAGMLPYDRVDLLKKVTIATNVWLGINVSVRPGVTIGEGSVVAMGSVVVSDVPPLALVGGNPAKIIGQRDPDTYLEAKGKGGCYLIDAAASSPKEYRYVK